MGTAYTGVGFLTGRRFSYNTVFGGAVTEPKLKGLA
jgi:hypothetical protein